MSIGRYDGGTRLYHFETVCRFADKGRCVRTTPFLVPVLLHTRLHSSLCMYVCTVHV